MILEIDLFRVFISDDNNLDVSINKWFIIGAALLLLLWFLLRLKKWKVFKSIEIDAVELGIGSQKIKLKPNHLDKQIAHRLWTELVTRKIGLKIDFESDVIYEIYSSWYSFFGITRELIKDIPIQKIEGNKDTQHFVDLAIEVLNVGLRPHLTKWQASFRRWYEIELIKDEEIKKFRKPQNIQKEFDDYEALVKDMSIVNKQLIEYRKALKLIAWGIKI